MPGTPSSDACAVPPNALENADGSQGTVQASEPAHGRQLRRTVPAMARTVSDFHRSSLHDRLELLTTGGESLVE